MHIQLQSLGQSEYPRHWPAKTALTSQGLCGVHDAILDANVDGLDAEEDRNLVYMPAVSLYRVPTPTDLVTSNVANMVKNAQLQLERLIESSTQASLS